MLNMHAMHSGLTVCCIFHTYTEKHFLLIFVEFVAGPLGLVA